MSDKSFDSTRMKVVEVERIRALAEHFNVFGYEIVRAWRLEFDRLSDDDQRAAVARALNLHPSARPSRVPKSTRRARVPA